MCKNRFPSNSQRDLAEPELLVRPSQIKRIFLAHVWVGMGHFVDMNASVEKEYLIRANATGVVLDIGAGHGHTVNYLDHAKVTKYIALEPNMRMHSRIRAIANSAGYTEEAGTLLILSCGAEDFVAINHATKSVDTLISVLTLCSVPNPETTLSTLVTEVLRPNGGQLLFYEHVLSDRKDVAWWQRFWTPIWGLAFDGCRLDRPTHRWVAQMGSLWKEDESRVWGKDGEEVENLFWHQAGRYVRS